MSCCGRKLLITEDDKKHILSLYGLIKEEPNPISETSTSAFKIDKTINFAPGYYRNKGPVTTKSGTYDWNIDNTLKVDLEKIREFLKNNPTGYVVEANLYSGESKIPNNDNELGIEVKENYLNKARLNSLKSYLNPIFESWKNEGITQTDFKINEYMSGGTTNWKGTPFCPENTPNERSCTTTYFAQLKAGDQTAKDYKAKYDAEQYFRVIIEVKKVDDPKPSELPSESGDTVTEGCATGLEVVIYVKSHECQNAEYLVYGNNTLLTNLAGGFTANLNNAGGKLVSSEFNFPAPDGYGNIYQTNDFNDEKKVFINGKTDIPAQALNPSYGYTKNGPYSANEEGDIRGERMDTFKVTADQSKTITEQGNGEINIWLIGTTKSLHLDIPYVLIRKDGKEVYNDQPKVESGLILTLSGCGNKVLSKSTTSVKPTGYESILANIYKERFDKIKQGLGANAVEDLSRKQLKDSKSVLLDRTLQLTNLINQVVLMGYDIYKKSFAIGKNSYFKGFWNSQGNIVARLNIYKQIQIILDQNPSYRKSTNGTYVDTNIEKSKKNPEKLMGDIYLKLEKFYEKYDIFYKNINEDYLENGLTYDEAVEKPGGISPLTGTQYVRSDFRSGEQVDTII